MPLIDREQKAKEMAEAQQDVGGLIFGMLPDIIAASRVAFERVGHAFFMVNWVNEIFSVGWRTLAYKWAANKNAHRTGNLFLDWASFGFITFFVFGVGTLIAVAQIAAIGVMLALNPFGNLLKAIYYTGKMIVADNVQERESHWENVKSSVMSAVISGVVSTCFAALIFVPVLPLAATTTLATITSLILIPPILFDIGTKLIKFGTWAKNSISKWMRKKRGLQGPGHRYDMRSGEGLNSEDLENDIMYIDKLKVDDNKDKWLFYRFKDKSGVRTGSFKQNSLPDATSWPEDLSEKEIQKLRPHFNLFATSLLNAGREKEEFPIRTSLSKNQKELSPVPFKPTLDKNESLPNEVQKMELKPSKEFLDYHSHERENYHAHLSMPAFLSIKEFIGEAQRQINQLENAQIKQNTGYLKFFEDYIQNQERNKRAEKIEALKILMQALTQWNALYKNHHPVNRIYNSIILDKHIKISHLLNPHLDINAAHNREIFIKRIEQYVSSTYPDAFQSFFREEGSVATLFRQGFNLMRSMKTEHEIEIDRAAIRMEINAYKEKYNGMRRYFFTDEQKAKRDESIELLVKALDGNDEGTIEAIKNNEDITSSRIGNGERWQIYRRILLLKKSEVLFENPAQSYLAR